MKLFLASEARHADTIEKLRKYIGGFEGKSIAYIPTAANGEDHQFGEWEQKSKTYQLIKKLGANVTPLQLEDYKDASVIDEIKGKDIVWFAGGLGGYLMYWVRRTQIDKQIRGILDAGTLYVGSSAGSWIASETLDIAEWFIGDEELGAKYIPGIGLVDFDIYPHYEESLFDEIKKNYKGKKLYLLKNGEEILVENSKITVQGEERIITQSYHQ